MVQSGSIKRQARTFRQRLGLRQYGEPIGDTVDDTHAGRLGDEPERAFAVTSGNRQRAVCRRDGFRRPTQFQQQPGERQAKRETLRGFVGELQAALQRGERASVFKTFLQLQRRLQIGHAGTAILGTLEVFCRQRHVARQDPLGGQHMQLAPTRQQQRAVSAVANQRMAKHQRITLRAQQELLHQQTAVVERIGHQMANRAKRHPRAPHGGGLQCHLVRRLQPVHARLDQRLDGAGQATGTFLAGAEQQLLQKQRIAFSTFDAATQQAVGDGCGTSGQAQRIVGRQGTQVNTGYRQSVQRRAPVTHSGISGKPCAHHEEQRMLQRERGNGTELLQGPGVGPVDIFHQHQQRRAARRRKNQCAQRIQRPLLAHRRFGGRQQGTHVSGRGHVEQVVQVAPQRISVRTCA